MVDFVQVFLYLLIESMKKRILIECRDVFRNVLNSSQGCSRLIDKRIESIEKNRKSPPSSGASAFVIDIFSQAPLIEID